MILAKDHTGRTFASISEMAKAWGISFSTFIRRLERGWDIERALTAPLQPGRQRRFPATDHHGKNFSSISEMCVFYDVYRVTFEERLKRGWSLEKALTTPVRNYKRGLYD